MITNTTALHQQTIDRMKETSAMVCKWVRIYPERDAEEWIKDVQLSEKWKPCKQEGDL